MPSRAASQAAPLFRWHFQQRVGKPQAIATYTVPEKKTIKPRLARDDISRRPRNSSIQFHSLPMFVPLTRRSGAAPPKNLGASVLIPYFAASTLWTCSQYDFVNGKLYDIRVAIHVIETSCVSAMIVSNLKRSSKTIRRSSMRQQGKTGYKFPERMRSTCQTQQPSEPKTRRDGVRVYVRIGEWVQDVP